MNLAQLIDYLSRDSEFQANLKKWSVIDAREGRYAPFPEKLDNRIADVLIAKGIKQLYTHQAESFAAVEQGKNIVVVTPTASGKTMTYNLPVLNHLISNPEARALYLFPTKALSQDQTNEVQDLNDRLKLGAKTFTFDGDTPADIRRTIRAAGNIVITNPDMLHQGILPHHTLWIKLFENLKFIVLDELHTYRGVFGSHISNLLVRLKRLCEFYGSKPQFICSSATIENPKELAEKILNEDVDLIDNNGSPSGEKHFLFYNPPVVNQELGLRRSVVSEVKNIVRKLLPTGAQIIIFARSRMRVELLVTYLHDLARELKIEKRLIRGYRGGYLPNQRREIEKGLKNGTIRVVVSTNALELGIDIGQLDVAIMAGYPGSVSSTWQQAGRAGRRQTVSLTIMVASSAPLDQYIIEHPEYFFGKSPESAFIDRENLAILMSHLKCASFELPFRDDENFAPHITNQLLDFLVDERVLRKAENKYFWMSEIYPADEVSLRNTTQENVVIIDTSNQNKVIGEIDLFAAQEMVHNDAIYIHDSIQYHVEKLDWEELKAYVHRVDSDHYTDAITKVDVKVLDVLEEESNHAYTKYFADVAVARTTTGYKKIKFRTHENIGFGRVYLPEIEMQTNALMLQFPDSFFVDGYFKESVISEGLKGIAYTMRNLVPLYVMCDSADIAVFSMVRDPFSKLPTIYVYDRYQGGIGLSKKLYKREKVLLKAVRDHIKDCPCSNGCPSCTGPTLEGTLLSKQSSLRILEMIDLN
ncbi:MAG: DEAD/DEAH box helicase [Calditrichae bacterium]|nr:DEAD/DEAH box helicase [Calditrichota bacterium]MCB9057201.1 DEAD/DEAH box helicase [Calditrichia bacterium]